MNTGRYEVDATKRETWTVNGSRKGGDPETYTSGEVDLKKRGLGKRRKSDSTVETSLWTVRGVALFTARQSETAREKTNTSNGHNVGD